MSSEIKYRSDVDGLRAVAIIAVLIFHAFPYRLQGGFVGVDVFFVISGFLISTIIFRQLTEGKFSYKDFYIKRVNRIFPSLFIMFAASYIFSWFGLFEKEFQQFGKHMMAGAGFVSNIVLYHEAGYFDVAATFKPLLHLWSLAVEEQFYIIWPPIIYLCFKKKFNLLTLVVVCASISFFLNMKFINSNASCTFYLLPTRFWELALGSFLAHVTLFKNDFILKLNSKAEGVLIKVIYQNGRPSKHSSI